MQVSQSTRFQREQATSGGKIMRSSENYEAPIWYQMISNDHNWTKRIMHWAPHEGSQQQNSFHMFPPQFLQWTLRWQSSIASIGTLHERENMVRCGLHATVWTATGCRVSSVSRRFKTWAKLWLVPTSLDYSSLKVLLIWVARHSMTW